MQKNGRKTSETLERYCNCKHLKHSAHEIWTGVANKHLQTNIEAKTIGGQDAIWTIVPVSYTHLDVYKRQNLIRVC